MLIKSLRPPPATVVTAIIPGRRALGEKWRKVTIGHDGSGYTIDNKPTEAPADDKPIFIPAMGNISADMADYLLEYQRKDAEYRKQRGQRSPPLSAEKINELFWRYCEERLRWFKGQTTSGPAITRQRESTPPQRHRRSKN